MHRRWAVLGGGLFLVSSGCGNASRPATPGIGGASGSSAVGTNSAGSSPSAAGVTGAGGLTGVGGWAGAAGTAGTTGSAGAAGNTGAAGTSGADGTAGAATGGGAGSSSHCPQATVVDPSTLAGKLMMGYQGWFGAAGDGSGFNMGHYGGIDPFPDMSDLADAGIPLYDYLTTFPGGGKVYVYSNYNPGPTNVHFRWMQQYDVSGAMLQRFTTEINGNCAQCFAFRNEVTKNVMAAAQTYGRTFNIMWDVSGDNDAVASIEKDWPYLVDTLKITESPRYQKHRGRPLVSIWGFATTNNSSPPSALATLIDYFHNNPNPAYRASVMGGMEGWNNATWKPVATTLDVISDWDVGGYAYHANIPNPYVELDNYLTNTLIPEAHICAAAGIDYMPVIWPGFSAHNETGGKAPLNQMPRVGGLFYWRQAYNSVTALKNAGLPIMVYNAMFDEVNEGTAMYKCIARTADLPVDLPHLALDADGYSVPSDWYLKLAGAAQQIVDGTAALTQQMPLDPKQPAKVGPFPCSP
jgi:hypothetical protein